MTRSRSGALVVVAALTALTGCSMNNSDDSKKTEIAGTRSVKDVDDEAKKLSSQLYDLAALKGENSGGGPGSSECGDDKDRNFLIRHSWSVTGASDAEAAQAMDRVKEGLPRQGWEVVSYERLKNKANTLALTADHHEKKFGVRVELWEKGKVGDDNPPALRFSLVSGCFQVPEGEKAEHY
ncbi:hypothetical protein ACFVIM_23545 [Streptomyces sp. NPDC057638]|uniref:hypothetical protein n=1 Tax=Streptomyces sp. NPDC057638 TaxID=3346190 RepID=UPI00368558C7